MKNTYQDRIRVASLAALTLAALWLFPGCTNEENGRFIEPGKAILSFNVAGIADAAEEEDTRSLPAPETVSQVQEDGTVLDFTLTPDVKTATRASTAMTAGKTYKYVVLDGTNKIVGSVNGQAGTGTGTVTVDNTQAYTIAAYSYNNTATMPSPGAVGAAAGSVAGPVNTDLLYFKESLAANTLAAGINLRPVTFTHKYSQVKVVVDATSIGANVTIATGFTIGPNYASTMAVVNGALTKSGASSPAPISFTSPNAQKVTSSTAILFPNGETPLTLSIGTLKIGATTYTGKTVNFTRALAAGISYTLTVSVHGVIPAVITLGTAQSYTLVSIYDTDYKPYSAPTAVASTATMAADGGADPTKNIQGSITTGGLTVKIPATVTASGTLPAYSTTVNVPASLTEDGISRDLTFSWVAQALTTGNTAINATIKAVGGTLNAKQLDINAGVGNDYLGVLLAQFSYPYNNAGNTTTFQVRDIAAIPDGYNSLYLPIVAAEDGNIWLNNNLGAAYAAGTSPASQATSTSDANAYGSYFQFGRNPDGHQLSSSATVAGPASIPLGAGYVGKFITNSISPRDWRTPQNGTLWAGTSGNNPCPAGFRVPTMAEITAWAAAAGIINANSIINSKLKLTLSGRRDNATGAMANLGSAGQYWSSSPNGTEADDFLFTNANYITGTNSRGEGYSVRCIKD